MSAQSLNDTAFLMNHTVKKFMQHVVQGNKQRYNCSMNVNSQTRPWAAERGGHYRPL